MEPLRDTVAADPSIAQEWTGIDMSASVWCVGEQPYMKLQEFKHSYGVRDRVLTLLILENAEPRRWDTSGIRSVVALPAIETLQPGVGRRRLS